eukprot:scaffold6963_cov175-Skeletonema_dohrnii-CCMP3373.AAC.1
MHAVTEADGEVHCGDEGDALPVAWYAQEVLVCTSCVLLAEKNQLVGGKIRRGERGKGEESAVYIRIRN